ncbi:nitrite reductase small subunit NirD [Salinibius halmophilus]|uniref:nitrite reductase small subunit NirD n=1 Tax=Salinibius halmophilus TaxID=1853216 RepID=UPI000E66D40D|nr:nitrite reductase small subunit NirD [Salinibius halmophilus]
MTWQAICDLEQIIPGTGVCALVNGQQVALFRPCANGEVFALSNIDPFAQASVLSRGLIGEQEGAWYVASPLKKQRFLLATGQCLEDDSVQLPVFKTKVEDQTIFAQSN